MRRFYCDVLGATHVAHRPGLGMSHLRVGGAMIDLIEVNGALGRAGGAAAQTPAMLGASYGQRQAIGKIGRFEHDPYKNVPPKAFVLPDIFGGEKYGCRALVFFK